ncbi:MAG: pilus assembly protein [Magnetospirillum sp. WYHS-4]
MTARRILVHLAGDRRGAAAIEFALIAPVMITLLAGIMELSYFLMAERRVVESSHAVADLIGQGTDLSAAEVDDILYAARQIMTPFPDSALKIGVASVTYDATTGAPSLAWTANYNSGSVSNPTTKATGKGQAGESVIIVTSSYTYTPILKNILTANFTLSETTYARPRTLSYVGKY